MTLGERLTALDAKFSECPALIAKFQKIHMEVFTELSAIAAEYGDEGEMVAMERMLKFQAALLSCQKGLYRTDPAAKAEPKKPDFSVQ
jgi:hypothetical protein